MILEEVKPEPAPALVYDHGDRELTIQEWEKEQAQAHLEGILSVLSSTITSLAAKPEPIEPEPKAEPIKIKKPDITPVRTPDNGKKRGTLA